MRRAALGYHSSTSSQGMPWRHLAVRVIDQAFRDLAAPAGSPADQASAREFLTGSPMLCRWCELADLDPAWTIARARVLIASSDQFFAAGTLGRHRSSARLLSEGDGTSQAAAVHFGTAFDHRARYAGPTAAVRAPVARGHSHQERTANTRYAEGSRRTPSRS